VKLSDVPFTFAALLKLWVKLRLLSPVKTKLAPHD
jgi:hypothetical protein